MEENSLDKTTTSFRLTREARALLHRLARRIGLSQSGYLEITIRHHAEKEGIKDPSVVPGNLP